MAVDNWEDILAVLTGWTLPKRADITGAKGDSGIPWMDVNIRSISIDASGLHPQNAPHGDGMGWSFQFFTGQKSNVSMYQADVTYKNIQPGKDFWERSQFALWHLLYDDFQSINLYDDVGGEPAPGAGVDLHTFTKAAQSFDAAGDFFNKQTQTLKAWSDAFGNEQAPWQGTAAGVFWHLIDDLHQKYDDYLTELRPPGFSPQSHSPSTGYTSTTLHGDSLIGAEQSLWNAYDKLYQAYGNFFWLKGSPISINQADGSQTSQALPADPRDILNGIMEDMGNWIAKYNWPHVALSDNGGGQGYMGHGTAPSWTTLDGFSDSPRWGHLHDTSTWANMANEATTRWTNNVTTNLDAPARPVVTELQQSWVRVLDPNWNSKFAFQDNTNMSLSQDLTNDLNSKQQSALNSALGGGNTPSLDTSGLDNAINKLLTPAGSNPGGGGVQIPGGDNGGGAGTGGGNVPNMNQLFTPSGNNGTGGTGGTTDPGLGGVGGLGPAGAGLSLTLGGSNAGGGSGLQLTSPGGDGGGSSIPGGANFPTGGGGGAPSLLTPNGQDSQLPNSLLNPMLNSMVTPVGSNPPQPSVTNGGPTSAPVTNKDGSVSRRNADGSVTTRFPDGSSTTVNPDGTVTTTQPDGQNVTSQLSPGQSLTNPDGSVTTVGKGGTVSTSFPDGSNFSANPDGTVTTTGADGTKTTTFPNGTVEQVGPNGQMQINSPDGSNTVQNPDGSVTTDFPGGGSSTVSPDGTVHSVTASGQNLTTQLNPGQSLVNPDGSNTTVDPAGDITTQLPDGSSFTVHPNGTLTTTPSTTATDNGGGQQQPGGGVNTQIPVPGQNLVSNGLTPNGLDANSLTPNGSTPNGSTPNGSTPNGLDANSLTLNSLTPNSLTPNGLNTNSLTPNGSTPNSLTPNGITPNGLDPNSLTPNSSTPNSLSPNGLDLGGGGANGSAAGGGLGLNGSVPNGSVPNLTVPNGLTTKGLDGALTTHFPSGTVSTTAKGMTTTRFPDGSSTVSTPGGQFQALPSPGTAAATAAGSTAADGAGGSAGGDLGAASAGGAGAADPLSGVTNAAGGLLGMSYPMMMMASMARQGQGGQQKPQERVRETYQDGPSDGAFLQHGGLAPQSSSAETPYEDEEEDTQELFRRPATQQQGYGMEGPRRATTVSSGSAWATADEDDVWGTGEEGLPASLGR